MNNWFDIQLNDCSPSSKGCANGSTHESRVSNNNICVNKSRDQSKSYQNYDHIQSYVSLAQIRSDNNCNNSNDNKNRLERLQSKESILSSPSLSPNCTTNERQFDFDSKEFHGLRNRRISLLVDELLNDIYCNLRTNRNRHLSVSSDTSNYSTPEFQKKPVFRDIYLKGKGMSVSVIITKSSF